MWYKCKYVTTFSAKCPSTKNIYIKKAKEVKEQYISKMFLLLTITIEYFISNMRINIKSTVNASGNKTMFNVKQQS